MPIRFRCAYCNQLMGIARRKAGTVVRCPTCGGQVVVPQPQQAPPAADPGAPQPAGDVFDQPDFGDVFQQPANGSSLRPNAAAPRVSASAAQQPAAYPSQVDVEPLDYGNQFAPGSGGVVLTTAKMVLLGAIVVMLLALSFVAGVFVGRGFHG